MLAEFRLYSVGAQLLFWSALALVLAPLADRALAGGERPALAPPARQPAAP